jgi:hypothetical protein
LPDVVVYALPASMPKLATPTESTVGFHVPGNLEAMEGAAEECGDGERDEGP